MSPAESWGATPPPPATPRSNLPAWITAELVPALVMGAMVFVAVALIGQALAFLQYFATDRGVSGWTVSRIGLLYFSSFHHAGVVVSTPDLGFGAPFGSGLGISYKVSIALLTVTLFAAWLLFQAGRAVAESAGGSPWQRAVHGLKVAPLYAVLSFGLSYAASFTVGGADNPIIPDRLHVSASHPSALLWPLAIAAVAGALGGVWSSRSHLAGTEPWGRRVFVAVGAGVRMFLLGLALAFVGLLVLAAVKPDATRSYFKETLGKGLVGTDAFVHHLLLLPNQSMWVLVPAMGGCDGAYSGGQKIDFLCYGTFPRNPGGFTESSGGEGSLSSGGTSTVSQTTVTSTSPFGTAPAGYFAFLLVPLGAVLLGGAWAASAGRAENRTEAVIQGALGGVVFSILVCIGSILAGFGVAVSGNFGGLGAQQSSHVGPSIIAGTGLALVWGLAGGALGAFLAARDLPSAAPRVEPSVPAWGP